MSEQPKIVCVVPSIRKERMAEFRDRWANLFDRHKVTLIIVWDGERPEVQVGYPGWKVVAANTVCGNEDLFCRKTDACRNYGFVQAAKMRPDFLLTLDDDVAPPPWRDPIAEHLAVLNSRVPISWMNTAHAGEPYLRGFPYGIRDEAPVMLSHGVWDGVPDFDGKTQLELSQRAGGVPSTLMYYCGPVPRGVLFPLCGMNVMIRREAMPHFYFAPMGPDSGVDGLNRFADIWMGRSIREKFDELGWAIYTGASTVIHTRASDPVKNVEQERLGIEWNEWMQSGKPQDVICTAYDDYMESWADKRNRYANLIRGILEVKS